MADAMQFPESWHQFLHDYEFRDSLAEYTNNSMLIPSFRVEQMIEHYFCDAVPVVRCKGCKHAERYERTDGTAGYYCGHPQSTFVYGERWDRVFKPVKKPDDFRIYRRPHLLQLRRTSHQPICGRAQYGTICQPRQNRRPK